MTVTSNKIYIIYFYILDYPPESCPLINTCKAWPADETVRTGGFPPLKNPSLGSISILNDRNKQEKGDTTKGNTKV